MLLIVLLVPFGVACKESYGVNENVTIFDSIVQEGNGSTCYISIYNYTQSIQNGTMANVNLLYSYDAGVLDRGSYEAAISCNQTITNSTYQFYGSCEFIVEEEDDMSLAAIILLPLVFAFVLLWISSNMDEEEHWVFKLFLNFLTIPLFFVSLHIAVLILVQYYGFAALQVVLARTTLYYGWMFAVMLFYVFIYTFWKFNLYNKIKKENRYD